MNLTQIVEKFLENPKRMEMGAGKLSRSYKCSVADIYNARELTREKLNKLKFKSFIKEDIVKTIKSLTKTKRNIESITPGIHIIQSCNHVPFQNKEMQSGLISLIKDLGDKVKGFHFLGDFLDMNSLSSHDINKTSIPGITLGYEYKEGNKCLDAFEEVLPKNIDKTFIYGNHEDRYNRHIKDINASKYADALISPEQALKLEERGYTVYTNWKEDYHQLGKLQLIHGEFCTQNPARSHLNKMKCSVMFGHTHRMDTCYDGEKAGFNIGWGGDINAPAFNYVSRLVKMNWINGFALVHIDSDGNYFTQVIPVFNNTFWYNGKKY